jgi:hypothetical protein
MLDLSRLSRARDRMVDLQIAARGVRDRYVLEAMRRVPRDAFVEPGFEEFAYEDGALPIADGQTISQPYTDWDGAMEIKSVRSSHSNSYERLCHDAGVSRFLLDPGRHEALRRRLLEARLERFIGVIYRPDTELMSHYVEASLPQQFDAFVWFDETSAVTPLGPEHAKPGLPDTYPFGL